MQYYVTVEEKALEWGVTPTHVRLLCRKGKIDGAVKRVGAWFIPDGTPIPVRNTKTNTHAFKFVGTKKRIFDSSIEMFMLNGYERVNIKDIADRVGIRQSTVYNHFKSKQKILDTIYDFYCHYYLVNRPTLGSLEHVIQNGSLMELMKSVEYEFPHEYEKKMSDISKIIFQRIAIDARAREITKSLIVDEGIKYVEAAFDSMVDAGRLAACDTHAMSVFINSIRLFIFYNWIADPSPDNIKRLNEDEHTLYGHAIQLLTDLKIQKL